MLKSIAETVLLSGHQGIALRRHCDDWKHIEEMSHSNPGIFAALLNFWVGSGDRVLAHHLALVCKREMWKHKSSGL